jgi:tRNA(Ile)-lysidine synthase
MDTFAARCLSYIEQKDLLQPQDGLLVAFSGGADSVALSLALLEISEEGQFPLDIHLAHLNHCLRGEEARSDVQFCRRFAEKHGLPLEIGRTDVPAARRPEESIEEAARRARYDFLAESARRLGCRVVAIGHHADDVAETVLMRLLRGCGLNGLGAMPWARSLKSGTNIRLVRPLLEEPKRELAAFLDRRNQGFCTDSSNRDVRYRRNRIRHLLLPLLESRCEVVTDRLVRINELAVKAGRELDAFTKSLAASMVVEKRRGELALDAGAYRHLSTAMRKWTARHALRDLDGNPGEPPGLRREHYDALAALVGRPVGTELTLPGGRLARCEHGLMYFRSSSVPRIRWDCSLEVPGCAVTNHKRFTFRARLVEVNDAEPVDPLKWADVGRVFLAASTVKPPLTVRNRRPGDPFYPLGAPGRKKLKDFLIDRKVPHHRRDRIPLVADATGRIIWVVGHEICHQCRLKGDEQTVLQLEAEKRYEMENAGTSQTFSSAEDSR